MDCDVDSLAEEVSDQCMGELTGIGVKPVKCAISSECIRVMTQRGRTGYHLTHQLIYGMLAEQVTLLAFSCRHCVQYKFTYLALHGLTVKNFSR